MTMTHRTRATTIPRTIQPVIDMQQAPEQAKRRAHYIRMAVNAARPKCADLHAFWAVPPPVTGPARPLKKDPRPEAWGHSPDSHSGGKGGSRPVGMVSTRVCRAGSEVFYAGGLIHSWLRSAVAAGRGPQGPPSDIVTHSQPVAPAAAGEY